MSIASIRCTIMAVKVLWLAAIALQEYTTTHADDRGPAEKVVVAKSDVPDPNRIRFGPHDWPWWRGPAGNNHSNVARPPLEWSDIEGVVWKKRLSGAFCASPPLAGGHLYVTDEKGGRIL